MNFIKSLFLSASLFLISSAQAITVKVVNASTYEQKHCLVHIMYPLAGTTYFEINTEYQDSTNIPDDTDNYIVIVSVKQHDNDTNPIIFSVDSISLENNGVLEVDVKNRSMQFFKCAN